MWAKRHFHKPKRLSISNPIIDHNSPLTELPVNNLSLRERYLAGLPTDSPVSLQPGLNPQDNKTRRNSDISALSAAVESHRHESRSSYCVSPIEGEQFPRYAENLRPLSSPAHHKTTNDQNLPSQLQPVQPQPEPRHFISGKPTDWEVVSREAAATDAGRDSQFKPRATSSHKRTTSTTPSLINWRQQFNPKKKFNAARSRIASFSKTEDHSQQGNNRSSSSRVQQMDEHSSKDERVADAIPQLDLFAFTPSSVTTTITAGGPVPEPPRPATEHAPSRTQENMPVFDFENDGNSMFANNEPRSRFSATTYTATEADSQPTSRCGSLQFDARSTDNVSTSSIMDRRRPIPSGMISSKKPLTAKPVRKPTPSQVAQQVAQMPDASPTPEPPLDTQGRIKAMETKRDELTQRRRTLETITDELSKATRPGTGVTDLAARAEMQKVLASMDVELADIRKELHQLGVGLTRAYKRLDEKENAGDGGNLWVRRVTG
ncbi:hypothetical protein N7461_000108 [Penicillium sp. DV-2018c]|nr:hypothetical protein N7461_000108 [Penicillium sp. DV-2018c]